MSVVLGPPLDRVSREARPYPAYLLQECATGLCLFAAAFVGHNDAIHFARQRLVTTCVDIDERRLAEMKELYPSDWEFVAADAWVYAEQTMDLWDAVSVDTFTGTATSRSLASLDLWCSVARRVVTCTVTDTDEYVVPDGWRSSLFERSGDVHWLVLTR